MFSRIRLRYSLRSSLLALTFICRFIGVWHHCRDWAIHDMATETGWTPDVVAPFLLCTSANDNITIRRTFHIWCFGVVVDLPFASEYPNPHPLILTVTPRVIRHHEPEGDLGITIPE